MKIKKMEKDSDDNEKNNDLLNTLIPSGKEDDNAILRKSQNSTSSNNITTPHKEYKIEKLPENITDYNKSIKVILLGDSNVGKTSIINCLEQKDLLQHQTISLEYFNYNIKINNYTIRMQIWDTVGHEKFNSITANYYKTTDIVLFVYAINDLNSFNNLEHWFNELNDKGNINISNPNNSNAEDVIEKNMIKILVGNKKDLINERKVTYEMGEKLRKEKNFHLFKEITCHYENKNEAIMDENSSDEIKEDNKNDNGNDNLKIENYDKEGNKNDDKDCVKNLFFEIGKIVYKEFIEDYSRMNSSVYCYEASDSILELTPEKSESDGNIKVQNNKKQPCCC